MERYGEAIEYDLQALLGLDLLDFFRHKLTWRKLVRLLGQLPTGSAYWAARADDEEVAGVILERNKGKRPKSSGSPLRLADMNPTNQLLVAIADGQTMILDRLERLGGTKPPNPKPFPVPLTALDRVERSLEATAVADLVAEAKAAQARAQELGGG